MDLNTLSFMSYNSTGLDAVKIKWINDLLQTCKVDFFQIQEHFKAIKSIDSYFKKNFTQFDSYPREAIRNSNLVGRPRGGLGQLVRKNNNVKKERIFCDNWRVQAQILHVKKYKLLWLNCYLPTDPQSQQFDESELLETL